ncbi:MAG TPA: hypothetical protein DCG75_06525 [Bacteroidales bacterium]|nr:hypothetical protein [Bacteroidales bacterium]
MNNNKLNIDDFTKDLIRKGEVQQPTSDFTKNVMSRILKDPSVNVSFITNDDKRSNIWLIITMSTLVVGFFIYYIITHGFSFSEVSSDFQTPGFFKVFTDIFLKFWGEITLSPYILLAFIGILVLVVIDKTIIKYLYSI